MRIAVVTTMVLCLFASTPGALSSSHYVIAFPGAKSSAVSLVRDADCVAMALEIQSSQKDPSVSFSEIKHAQRLLHVKAKEQAGITIHKGSISLSPTPASKFGSFSGYSASSAAQFHVMVKLDEDTDVYASATRIRGLLDSVELPGKTSYRLGQIELAVANPEKSRREILEKISEDVEFVRTAMPSSGQVSITGLEGPVLVRQVDDRKIELFINYSMTMELLNRPGDAPKE